MPLVTRNSNSSSHFKGTTAQESTQTMTEGDTYYNTQTDILKSYDGSTLTQVGQTSFSSAAVVSQSTTIGDYTTPSSAVGSEISPTFSDDFSGADAWTDQDSAKIGVNTTTDVLDFNFVTDGTNDACTYDLGAGNVSDTAWVLRFKFHSTTITDGAELFFYIGLSKESAATLANAAHDFIGLALDYTTTNNINAIDTDGQALNGVAYDATNATPFSNGSDHWIEITRTAATTYTVKVFSESTYTTQVGSTMSGTCASTTDGLRYISLINANYASGSGSFVGYLDDIKFYNAVTTVTTASLIWDDNTATKFYTGSIANPNIYVDMGSALNLCGAAIYWDGATSTETSLKIQVSTDATTWVDKRLITTSNLTNGSWNYYRFNIAGGYRYVRFYGNSGSSSVLAIWEIKILKKTDAQIFADLGILEISSSDSTLGASGT